MGPQEGRAAAQEGPEQHPAAARHERSTNNQKGAGPGGGTKTSRQPAGAQQNQGLGVKLMATLISKTQISILTLDLPHNWLFPVE